MDKISLIVPVYNVKEYLTRCLDSIVEQDYPNLEVILVNDGSTDEPESIIQNYLSKYEYIHYVEQKNKGVGAARNRGMSIASGEYISFVDSDDVLYPDYCSFLYNW